MAKKVVKAIRKTPEQYERAAFKLGVMSVGMLVATTFLTQMGSETKFDLYYLYACRAIAGLGALGTVDYLLTADKIRKETAAIKREIKKSNDEASVALESMMEDPKVKVLQREPYIVTISY